MNDLPPQYEATNVQLLEICLGSREEVSFIVGAERVTEAFGGTWPCFHDASIESIELYREAQRAVLSFEVVKRDYDHTTPEGYFLETHRGLVSLAFDECYVVSIDGFSDESAIDDLKVQRGNYGSDYSSGGSFRYLVSATGLMGAGFELLCNGIAVLKVESRPVAIA